MTNAFTAKPDISDFVKEARRRHGSHVGGTASSAKANGQAILYSKAGPVEKKPRKKKPA